ncbi:2-oxoglutarate and Fe(II)-dependent oxygenase superfamily protein [Prunus dulcis]|uniref:2-oxoglutarate and Fe(II)-dependent oxygenase superfamily protein n=1 Tax=Prunus dulcis TaxID=3755 RepID=A0A4Y1RXE2_PRUDU|nr:2-oxoglutarate and Fe(II)-dependent oxygenase superfamily protein [Prunus dulcis]
MEPPSSPLPFPTDPRPQTTCASRKLRKNDGNSSKRTETSRPPISLLRPPFPSTQAPEARQKHRRDLQEVQLARTSSCRSAHASTTGPLLASAPPRSVGKLDLVEDFGYGQNTGETLPNFRQESKGSFNSNCNRKGKKVICARHSPGVGHAQDLARISKWNWDRVLSLSLQLPPFLKAHSFQAHGQKSKSKHG